MFPLKIAQIKPVKVRIVAGDGSNKGGVYPALTASPMVEGVDTEGRRGGGPFKDSRKGKSVWRKGKSYIKVLELVGATPVSPKDADVDAEKGGGGWEGRRKSGSKIMNRVLFTDIPESDSDYKFTGRGVIMGRRGRRMELRIRQSLFLRKYIRRKKERFGWEENKEELKW